MEQQILDQIIGSGISGAILILIVLPIVKWMRDNIDKKDTEIKELITNHLNSALKARMELTQAIIELKSVISVLPVQVVDRVKQDYFFKKRNKQ